MFSTGHYSVARSRLEPGDSLLLYTDGVTEARNGAGAEYGLDRLTRVLATVHGRAAREIADSVREDLEAFRWRSPRR